MREVITLIFLTTVPLIGLSQPDEWTAIEYEGVFSNIRSLEYSENLGITLFLNGLLHENGRREISGYNGIGWSLIADSIVGHVTTFSDYNQGIVIGGSSPAMFVGGQEMPHVAYYNGENWSAPWEFNDTVRKLKVVNDTLFALGNFTQIDGQGAFKIAKLIGNQWVGVLNPHPTLENSGIFGDIAYYNGDYYVSGNFNGQGIPQDFARLNNGVLEEVGGGITGGLTGITDLVVFQDELYLSGLILFQEGLIGNNLLRWDGQNFHGMGSVFYNQYGGTGSTGLPKTKKHGEYLYCAGNYRFIDDQPFYGVARWDGTQWCELYTQEFDQDSEWEQPVHMIGFFEDQLLLLKAFFTNEEETEYQALWAYDVNTEPNYCHFPVSVPASLYSLEFTLFPNPSSSHITLQSESRIDRLEILDVSGRVVLIEKAFPKDGRVDISALPSGIYLVKVETSDGFGVRKLMVD